MPNRPDPSAPHREHDLLLIAALADIPDVRSSDDPDHARALTFIAECSACATLHADLVALAVATRALPTPALPRRDFRLTEVDAARLRPSGWRRLVGVFAGPRDAITRPLAMGLTTLGLAGLLIGSIPAIGPSAAELLGAGRADSALEPAPAATVVPVFGAPTDGQGEEPPTTDGQGPRSGSEGVPGDTMGRNATDKELAPDPTGLSTLIVISGSLLIIGLGLFALRWTARRFGD